MGLPSAAGFRWVSGAWEDRQNPHSPELLCAPVCTRGTLSLPDGALAGQHGRTPTGTECPSAGPPGCAPARTCQGSTETRCGPAGGAALWARWR